MSVNLYIHCGKLVVSPKTKYMPTLQAILKYIRKENEYHVNQNTFVRIFIVALFIIAKNWKQSRCLSVGEWVNKQYLYSHDGTLPISFQKINYWDRKKTYSFLNLRYYLELKNFQKGTVYMYSEEIMLFDSFCIKFRNRQG